MVVFPILYNVRVLSKIRWWPSLKLISTIVDREAVITSFFCSFNKGNHSKNILTFSEIQILEKIVNPVQKMTEILAGKSYMTIPIIVPLCKRLKNILKNVQTDTGEEDETFNMFNN